MKEVVEERGFSRLECTLNDSTFDEKKPKKLKKGLFKRILPFAGYLLLAAKSLAVDVGFQWDASPDSSVAGYFLYCRPISSTQAIKVFTTNTSRTIKGLIPSVQYVVWATATDGVGNESPPSNLLRYSPGGVNLVDTTSPTITATNGQAISDLYPPQLRSGFAAKGTINNPFYSTYQAAIQGVAKDNSGIENVSVTGNTPTGSIYTEFEYFTLNSKFTTYIYPNPGTNAYLFIAKDIAGNTKTSTFYVANLSGHDNNKNGMDDGEEIIRGYNPFIKYNPFINITKTPNNDVNIVFSAISTQPYQILTSKQLNGSITNWNETINPSLIKYTTNGANGLVTGSYTEKATNDIRFYQVLDNYDYQNKQSLINWEIYKSQFPNYNHHYY